jgi:hypothetical protein
MHTSFLKPLQAEVAGCSVTWLVPHQLAQVLPADVDFTVMLTFLEFYATLVQFFDVQALPQPGAAVRARFRVQQSCCVFI